VVTAVRSSAVSTRPTTAEKVRAGRRHKRARNPRHDGAACQQLAYIRHDPAPFFATAHVSREERTIGLPPTLSGFYTHKNGISSQ
jgi:hypothetical protein